MYEKLKQYLQLILRAFLITFFMGIIFYILPAQAKCEGCLCPGDPCKLCPLPALKDASTVENEPEICARIREKVPPTSAQPGSNEYFPDLDKSIAVCVNEGGDVIRNRQKNTEFTSRFYCKPPNLKN